MKDNLLSLRKIFWTKHFFLDPHHDLNRCSFYGLFMVTLLKILLCKEPILKFKGNVPHDKKGHPTLETQVDFILQN